MKFLFLLPGHEKRVTLEINSVQPILRALRFPGLAPCINDTHIQDNDQQSHPQQATLSPNIPYREGRGSRSNKQIMEMWNFQCYLARIVAPKSQY